MDRPALRPPRTGSISSWSSDRGSRRTRRSSASTSMTTPTLVEQLRHGDHLVGSLLRRCDLLLAAAPRELVRSLTVLEPPCTRVATGHPGRRRFAADGRRWWAEGPRDDPEAFMRGFLRYVGRTSTRRRRSRRSSNRARERCSSSAAPGRRSVPLDGLAAASLPMLVVSGAHHAAFDAICDVARAAARAERLVLPGYGHAPQRTRTSTTRSPRSSNVPRAWVTGTVRDWG